MPAVERRAGRIPILRTQGGSVDDPNATGQDASLTSLEEPRYPATRAEWETFPVQTVPYDDDEVRGKRLLVDGWSVMEEWERPVEQRVIQELFGRIPVHRPTILIGGEGMGFATQTALDEARKRGGARIIVVELHPSILAYGRRRAARFMENWSQEEKERVQLEFVQGDFKDVINDTDILPDGSVDGARIDLFPLSPDEKDIDSFVHMKALTRVLSAWAIVAPYIGHEEGPTERQLSYTEFVNERGERQELFARKETDWVWVRPPKDCKYFNGKKMVVGFWSRPIKPMLVSARNSAN